MSVVNYEPRLTSEFAYELPSERIAQTPIAKRDEAKLLYVNGAAFEDLHVRDFPGLLREGDLVVANETTVRAARIAARRESGGEAELLVLSRLPDGAYECLVRPGKKLHAGSRVEIADDFSAVIEGDAPGHPGARTVRFHGPGDIDAIIERHGKVPLPPYIHENLQDPNRYQTVFRRGRPRSVAAPTAGLHLTEQVLQGFRDAGVGFATVQLEVGLGTFVPVSAERIEDHVMHHEVIEVTDETADLINETRKAGGRIIGIGTTTVRTLESIADESGAVHPFHGSTDLYIRPGYRYRTIDGLLTNFHQPRSSLLLLVSAFLGGERWRDVYAHALAHDYRFLSFGDCMFAWRG